MIRLKNLSLGYGGNAVIEGIDLTIAAGDFVVIGGPNGGGKSTLLRGISKLIFPLAGTVECANARFGYVPQHASIEQALPVTAREMVELGASASLPWWKTLITPRASFHHQALRECKADGFADKPFPSLSGGQRQRVLLARALASSPNCLLLDEPTAGVDRATQQALAKMLGDLNRESGLTIVLVTHEFEPFHKTAQRFLWVQDGRVRERSAADFAHGDQSQQLMYR